MTKTKIAALQLYYPLPEIRWYYANKYALTFLWDWFANPHISPADSNTCDDHLQ